MPRHLHEPQSDDSPLLADHPALDFLNTVSKVDGQLIDALQTDDDVIRLLDRLALRVQREGKSKHGALLTAARELRELVRTAVGRRKASKPVDIDSLNRWLTKGQSYLKVLSRRGGKLDLQRRWHGTDANQILAPLVESAAELIATANFDLVRRCEDDTCVLWFYDRTKSHHRRWCSMSTCGNRNKVKAFRTRRQPESE